MKAYSLDLRQRVLADCDAGVRTQAVAQKYSVSRAWVRRLKQRRRETGEVAPRRAGGRRHAKIDPEVLAQAVQQQPDATLAQRREALGLSCSLSALWYALRRLKITFKKKPRCR